MSFKIPANPLSHQEVKYLNIKDLVLWTENPRDDINPHASDQDIVNQALSDNRGKWTLSKLAKEMGDYYDLSELPTVVFHGTKPIVYDGNRRIILGKIQKGYVKVEKADTILIPDFPNEIPCNVCSEEVALNNVHRKHVDTGSWQPLERDIFLHKLMKYEKSPFLILEEETGIISANPDLNQRFVKEEIFKEETLATIGFEIREGRLYSSHNGREAKAILADIAKKVSSKQISTRNNRGKVLEILSPKSQKIIDNNKGTLSKKTSVNFKDEPEPKVNRETKRTTKKPPLIFGGNLYLKFGDVSDLYRDIKDLYHFYEARKSNLSESFPSLIRMSLRLLCETAQKDMQKKKLEEYIGAYFETAKKTLSKDLKTTLSNNNVKEETLPQLLHTGAHNYKAANNMDQTLAISIITGAILSLSHGKE